MILKTKSKVTIVGAGNVGSHAAVCTVSTGLADVVLLDQNVDLAKGKALDITQSMSLSEFDNVVIGTGDYKETANSDVVIVTAGVARKPGMSRDDLLDINATIIESVVNQAVKYSPECILIIVTNPINTMVQLAYEVSGLPKNQVIGMAGVLDSSRFKMFIAQELQIGSSQVETMVLGDHGALMVPLVDHCTVKGKPIRNLLEESTIDKIVNKVQHGGSEIVKLMKHSSAYYAPGISVVEMVKAILNDSHKMLPCAVLLEGEYEIDDLYVGIPAKLGKKGVEEIVEISLSGKESNAFLESVKHIRKRTEALLERRRRRQLSLSV